jgi:hypothetical protein
MAVHKAQAVGNAPSGGVAGCGIPPGVCAARSRHQSSIFAGLATWAPNRGPGRCAPGGTPARHGHGDHCPCLAGVPSCPAPTAGSPAGGPLSARAARRRRLDGGPGSEAGAGPRASKTAGGGPPARVPCAGTGCGPPPGSWALAAVAEALAARVPVPAPPLAPRRRRLPVLPPSGVRYPGRDLFSTHSSHTTRRLAAPFTSRLMTPHVRHCFWRTGGS